MECIYCAVGNHYLCQQSVLGRYASVRTRCTCLRREHRMRRTTYCYLTYAMRAQKGTNMPNVTLQYEPEAEQQYGGATWVDVLVDGKRAVRVQWVNGRPFLRVQTEQDMQAEREVRDRCIAHNSRIASRVYTKKVS